MSVSTVPLFTTMLLQHGSDAEFHRIDSTIVCPCVTPEGSRDPEWHIKYSLSPVCNEAGKLPDPANEIHITCKAFCQPIQSTRATRLQTEFIQAMFSEIEADDHLGIFPVHWQGVFLNFHDWSQRGEDYIVYNSRKFIIVNANLIPDPGDGNPEHHWELGLRLRSP